MRLRLCKAGQKTNKKTSQKSRVMQRRVPTVNLKNSKVLKTLMYFVIFGDTFSSK